MALAHKKSISQRLLSGSVWSFSARISTALAGFLVNALLARLLAPEELGVYFLAFSVVTFLALLAQLGLKQAVVRLVAESLAKEDYGHAKKVIAVTFSIITAGVFIVGLFYFFVAGQFVSTRIFESTLLLSVTGITVFWVATLAYQTILAETFRGLHDIRYASLFGGFCTSFLSMIFFALLWIIKGDSNIKEVMTLAVCAGAGSGFIAASLLGSKISKYDASQAKTASGVSVDLLLHLYFSGLVVFLMQGGHLWILGAYRPEDEVAIYGAAYRIVNLVAMPLLIINNVIPPMISDLYCRGDKKRVRRVLQSTASFAGIPSIIILTIFIMFGKDILGIVFGDFYREAYSVLVILTVGKIVNVFTGSPSVLLVMSGNQRLSFYSSLISGFISLFISYCFVEAYGSEGVAAGLSLGLVMHNVIMWLACIYKVGIPTHMSISKTVISDIRTSFLSTMNRGLK